MLYTLFFLFVEAFFLAALHRAVGTIAVNVYHNTKIHYVFFHFKIYTKYLVSRGTSKCN